MDSSSPASLSERAEAQRSPSRVSERTEATEATQATEATEVTTTDTMDEVKHTETAEVPEATEIAHASEPPTKTAGGADGASTEVAETAEITSATAEAVETGATEDSAAETADEAAATATEDTQARGTEIAKTEAAEAKPEAAEGADVEGAEAAEAAEATGSSEPTDETPAAEPVVEEATETKDEAEKTVEDNVSGLLTNENGAKDDVQPDQLTAPEANDVSQPESPEHNSTQDQPMEPEPHDDSPTEAEIEEDNRSDRQTNGQNDAFEAKAEDVGPPASETDGQLEQPEATVDPTAESAEPAELVEPDGHEAAAKEASVQESHEEAKTDESQPDVEAVDDGLLSESVFAEAKEADQPVEIKMEDASPPDQAENEQGQVDQPVEAKGVTGLKAQEPVQEEPKAEIGQTEDYQAEKGQAEKGQVENGQAENGQAEQPVEVEEKLRDIGQLDGTTPEYADRQVDAEKASLHSKIATEDGSVDWEMVEPEAEPEVEPDPVKMQKIREACIRSDFDELAKLAVSDGGFLTDELRQLAWPVLLGIPLDAEGHVTAKEAAATADISMEDADAWKRMPEHRDEGQVKLDVERAFVHYPNHTSSAEEERQRVELSDLIVEVLRRQPFLCYFQGFHDICQVLLLVLPAELRTPAVLRLALLRIRDFMLPTIDAAVQQLQLLPDILRVADPPLWEHLRLAQHPRPFFALSGTLTMYAHDMRSLGAIARVFDVLLARPPAFSLHLFAAIVCAHRAAIFATPADEPEMLHHVLSKLPGDAGDRPLDALVADAARLYTLAPPHALPAWRAVAAASVLKTADDAAAAAAQTPADGQRLFREHVRALERAEQHRRRREHFRQVFRKYRGPLHAAGLAVLVGILAMWLRRNNSILSVFWSGDLGGPLVTRSLGLARFGIRF